MTEAVCIVTGGSTGIGLAISEHLLADGYTVISLDRRKPRIEHSRFHSVEVDLFDAEATNRTASEVVARYPVTSVVHNAGVIRAALLPEVKLSDLYALTRLHLGAVISLVQAALPTMQERNFGRVVLISSRAIQGLPKRTSYSATKAGMIGMGRTWALELAPNGVTVNVVAPGPVHTDMFYDAVPAGSPKERELADAIPVGRIGEPGDIARAVLFFLKPENSFVTGQTLYVCGGSSINGLSV